ncbi:unnamed protein product [Discosporangium mesarthrocarpum]
MNPSKRFICKVMFLVAVAKSWQLSNGAWFDGKIGIWPLRLSVKAKCSSKNHAAGDMETKPVTMDGKQYKQIIMKDIIPAIKARMPGASTRTTWVHPDSAKPHTTNGPLRQQLGKTSYWKPSHPTHLLSVVLT